MELYFFRHGHSEDAQGPDFDDFARKLTDKGIERTRAAGRGLVKLGVKPAKIFTSPRLRARQTADILAGALGVTPIAREEMNFGFNHKLLPALINEMSNDLSVMFVGHEPDLSILVSSLIGGGEIEIKKGGLVRVDLLARMPLRGVLLWALTPRTLEVVGAN